MVQYTPGPDEVEAIGGKRQAFSIGLLYVDRELMKRTPALRHLDGVGRDIYSCHSRAGFSQQLGVCSHAAADLQDCGAFDATRREVTSERCSPSIVRSERRVKEAPVYLPKPLDASRGMTDDIIALITFIRHRAVAPPCQVLDLRRRAGL